MLSESGFFVAQPLSEYFPLKKAVIGVKIKEWTRKVEQKKEKGVKIMGRKQKSYTQEFKQQIVELHSKAGKGITELSNEYGVPKGTISTWIKNLTPIQVSETEYVTLKEFKSLQKRLKELEIENEILKKATAIFAKNQ